MSIQESSAPSAEIAGKKTLAERIASLTPEQRALYERKRRELQKKEEKPFFTTSALMNAAFSMRTLLVAVSLARVFG